MDNTFLEKFYCKNGEDTDEIQEKIMDILAIEDKIRDLREQKKVTEAELIDLDKTVKWEMTPELTIQIKQKTTFKANKGNICDLHEIPEDFRRLLVSQPFNKGPLKKDEKYIEGDDYEEIAEDRFTMSKVNPEILKQIVFANQKEAEYLESKKEA